MENLSQEEEEEDNENEDEEAKERKQLRTHPTSVSGLYMGICTYTHGHTCIYTCTYKYIIHQKNVYFS